MISFYLNHGYVAKVINEHMDGVAAATSHKFANGQEIFGCYDIDLSLDERGIEWKLSEFSSSTFAAHARIGRFLISWDDGRMRSAEKRSSALATAFTQFTLRIRTIPIP